MPTRHRGAAVGIGPDRPADQPQVRALPDRTPPAGVRHTEAAIAWSRDTGTTCLSRRLDQEPQLGHEQADRLREDPWDSG
jgi:hypothetical protein